jgi:hypothetical protein
MNNWCICWFSRIFLLGILIFKGLTARRLYKFFGVKGLNIIIGKLKEKGLFVNEVLGIRILLKRISEQDYEAVN